MVRDRGSIPLAGSSLELKRWVKQELAESRSRLSLKRTTAPDANFSSFYLEERNMKVSNIQSSKGNAVANQFCIDTGAVEYFQSYDSIIIKVEHIEDKEQVYLDEIYWDYSKTTSKYRNQFLGETTKEIKAKINSGKYILIDLNNGEI